MGLELPCFLPTVMHGGDHRAGKGLTPAQDPTLAPLPSYAGARPLAGFSSGRCCGASVSVRRRGTGRPRALKMLGSVVHPRAGSTCRPRQLVGAAGTLPRRLPLSTRTRTGWQVREEAEGGHVHAWWALGGCSQATGHCWGAARGLVTAPHQPLSCTGCPQPRWAVASGQPALLSSGVVWAPSQPWIRRLLFSSISFFPQCVIATRSPPQLRAVLPGRGALSLARRDAGAGGDAGAGLLQGAEPGACPHARHTLAALQRAGQEGEDFVTCEQQLAPGWDPQQGEPTPRWGRACPRWGQRAQEGFS